MAGQLRELRLPMKKRQKEADLSSPLPAFHSSRVILKWADRFRLLRVQAEPLYMFSCRSNVQNETFRNLLHPCENNPPFL